MDVHSGSPECSVSPAAVDAAAGLFCREPFPTVVFIVPIISAVSIKNPVDGESFYGYSYSMRTGRPPKAPEERRTDSMKIPLTEAEKAVIQEAAGVDESKPVTWARDVLLRAAARRNRK